MEGILLLKDESKSNLTSNNKYQIEALMPCSHNNELYNIFYCLEEKNRKKENKNKYLITIYTDLKESFSSLCREEQKTHIINSYNKNKDIINQKELDLIMKMHKNHEEDLLKEVKVIVLDFDINKSLDYISKNEKMYDKNIVIYASIYEDFDRKKALEIVKNIPNLYVKIEQNSDLITFDEFISTKDIIDNSVKEIETFNFSPIEKIMYVYDIAKDHIYKRESEGENQNISRNLTSVLLGDKIVCVGYAEILNTILNKLGIKSYIIPIFNKEAKTGHAINAIYVKDDKYNIEGTYYFDATADRKRNDSNEHMLRYKFFAKTIKEINLLEQNHLDVHSKNLNKYFNMSSPEKTANAFVKDITKLLILHEITQNTSFLEKVMNLIKSINYFSSLSESQHKPIQYLIVLKNQRELLLEYLNDQGVKDIEETFKKYMKPINPDTLIEVLYNVRKQQYYNNPEKYPFSKEEFLKATIKSSWIFDEIVEDFRKKKINQEEIKTKQEEVFEDYIENSTLERDISRVKLVRTLKNISNKK